MADLGFTGGKNDIGAGTDTDFIGACTPYSSCMTESIEIGCSHGMNGNALNGNVCSMIPTNETAPTIGGQILPELFLPTFSSREQSAVHFLKDLDEYLKLKSVDECLKLTLVSKSLTEEFAKNWFMATKEHINSYEEFKIFGSILE